MHVFTCSIDPNLVYCNDCNLIIQFPPEHNVFPFKSGSCSSVFYKVNLHSNYSKSACNFMRVY